MYLVLTLPKVTNREKWIYEKIENVRTPFELLEIMQKNKIVRNWMYRHRVITFCKN